MGGRGLAGRLLEALAERAQEEAIQCFEAPVLATNLEAISLLARLGKPT
jgi:RimJ/RimL family protein N-acetyltransferase